MTPRHGAFAPRHRRPSTTGATVRRAAVATGAAIVITAGAAAPTDRTAPGRADPGAPIEQPRILPEIAEQRRSESAAGPGQRRTFSDAVGQPRTLVAVSSTERRTAGEPTVPEYVGSSSTTREQLRGVRPTAAEPAPAGREMVVARPAPKAAPVAPPVAKPKPEKAAVAKPAKVKAKRKPCAEKVSTNAPREASGATGATMAAADEGPGATDGHARDEVAERSSAWPPVRVQTKRADPRDAPGWGREAKRPARVEKLVERVRVDVDKRAEQGAVREGERGGQRPAGVWSKIGRKLAGGRRSVVEPADQAGQRAADRPTDGRLVSGHGKGSHRAR